MKYCTQCRYGKKDYVNQIVQTSHGPQPRSGQVYLCTHPDYGHPVTGEELPCIAVRENERFCGPEAHGWVEKNEIKVVSITKDE